MEWAGLSSYDIGSLDRGIPVVLPIAATEQHGPHLPVATDTLIGNYFCRRLDERISARVLFLPAVTVACSQHHMGFPGTLTVSHLEFIRYVTEILASVAANGFTNIVLFNSHGGNEAAGRVIAESFGISHPGCRVTLLTWWRLAPDELMQITETGPGGVGHACEFETSLMEVIAPELVHKDRISKGGNIPTFDWAESDMLRASRGLVSRSMKEMTGNGVFGDPTAASPGKGEAIIRAVLTAAEKIITELGRADLP